ncbi:glycoside hydrolase family 6 protein [Streptomyces sp. VRA16 Mangrove soil]|uniref:glycoside hydrolase family 6 protein n=1 Tax=Streptomyces sp. VRA16 Mangrove soil TaxID=2817434 RepID=UPI001A9E488B|nr:glycoside hydrolase family 6 protein [Streptomyces sp. VRA16 Mangrove soil]MBO1336258.1 glycoside hydrolase family 6 protein [Streptomyces sp. VRA16 Mangrove soil]
MPVPSVRTRPARTFARTAAAALLLSALTAGCSDDGAPSPTEAAGQTAPSPTTGDTSPFWVDPASDAAVQAAQWEKEGRASDADVIRRIARHPQGMWAPGDYPRPAIAEAGVQARKADKTLVLVAYNIPHRDCGQHSAGGAHSADFYHQWIDAFATGIGDAKALVVLEPDALGHIVDGCTPEEYREERYTLIGSAIDRLKQQPNTKVYVDAGNPAWIPDASKLVEPLRRAGVERADGFSLNVSNFQTDEASSAYGKQLSRLLGGAHFVVDTSRNGAGPYSAAGADAWCNPPGRALGTAPTARTGDPLIDAYLWVKRPGESDGACRGGPAAGTWWADYALGLARNSRT